MADEHDKHGGGEGHEEGHGGGSHGGGGHGHGGGGHEEGHEGAPEWLISFADNVALMMGFFVILLAMNMAKPQTGGVGGQEKNPSADDNPAMTDFVIAMRKAFNNPPDAANPADAVLVRRLRERDNPSQGDAEDRAAEGDKTRVQAVRPTDYVNIAGVVPFPEATSVLTDQGKKNLSAVADKIKGMQWIIEVRGHVSATETKRDKERGMRLGFERALVCAHELAALGVRWEQLRTVACSDNERATGLAKSASEHASNQRVEIVITQEPMPKDPYAGAGEGSHGPMPH